MPSSLVADAAALVDNFSAGREQLRAFAEAHPVEAIYSELSASTSAIDAAAVAVVARALAKVFADPELAAAWLPETLPFAVAALRSSEAPEQLRALAAEALGRCVAAGIGGEEEHGGTTSSPSSSSDDAATALVEALGDRSASVGAAAERGGRLAAATEVGARSLLRARLVSKMSLGGEQQEAEGGRGGGGGGLAAVARARALSVAAAALSAGAGPAAALREAGAFSAVSEQLSLERASRDPLSAASALATISDAVSGVLEGGEERGGGGEGGDSAARAAAVGSLLAAEVGRPLARLLSSSGTSPKVAFAVRMQAMQTAAKLVAAAVAGGGGGGGGGGGAEGGRGNGAMNIDDNDSTDAAAVAAAPAASSSSPIPSPSSPVGGLAAALLASIERSLDEEAALGRDGEIVDDGDEDEGAATSSSEEEASLLALAELASTAGGASLVAAASPDALADAARIALGGRGGSACRLAALHALASVAGVERMRRRRRSGGRGTEEEEAGEEDPATGLLLPGAGESVLASALHSGASTRAAVAGYGEAAASSSSPAGALLSLISRQPLLDEKVAALRLALALCARPWGAAEVAMHPALLARLVDVGADAAGAAAEWRHAVCVALAETIAATSVERGSLLGPTQLSALAAARPAVEAAVRAGPHGIGGPAPRFVATRAAN